jgi:hydrogenase/urease accessory protein HupE
MGALRAANLTLRFLLELCALAAVAYWGSRVSDSTAVNVALAVAAPLALATYWGVVLSPKAKNRPDPPLRTVLELGALGLAVAALATAGEPVLAAILAVTAVLNGWALGRSEPAPRGA